jgi:methyl-accepting chemotaxis protein
MLQIQTIKGKLITFFGIMLIILTAFFLILRFFINSIIHDDQTAIIIKNMKIDILEARREEKNLIIRGYVQEHITKWENAMAAFDKKADQLNQQHGITEVQHNELSAGIVDFQNIFTTFTTDLKNKQFFSKDEISSYDNKFKVFGRKSIEILDSVTVTVEQRNKQTHAAFNIIFISGFVGVIGLIGVLGFWIYAAITKPIVKTTSMLRDIADGDGDLSRRLEITSKDEIGEMGLYFNRFVKKLQEMISKLTSHSGVLVNSVEQLLSSSVTMASTSKEMSSQTRSIAAATEEASTNIKVITSSADGMSNAVNSIATAIEEMTVSLLEVSKSCQQELRIASDASSHAQSGKEIIDKLGDSAKSISKIVEVITTIADQTNLLSLNATIEAASAGDAGKGFAVVASEVKALAKQTSQATDEIRGQIESIQSNTLMAVDVIQKIANVIDEVNSISQTIVSAIEQQSATVSEISRNISSVNVTIREVAHNVNESSKGIEEVSRNVNSFSDAIDESNNSIVQVKENVHSLKKISDDQNSLIGAFKV